MIYYHFEKVSCVTKISALSGIAVPTGTTIKQNLSEIILFIYTMCKELLRNTY